MAYEIPFGLRSAALYPLTGNTPGAKTDVPRVQTLEYNIERETTEMEASDVIVATHTHAKKVTGSFESGGQNLAVRTIAEGGTLVISGVTPSVVRTYEVKGTDAEGYYQAIGQSYNNDGGDTWVKMYRLKTTGGPSGSANQGEFGNLGFEFEGSFNTATPSRLMDIIQHETITAIPA